MNKKGNVVNGVMTLHILLVLIIALFLPDINAFAFDISFDTPATSEDVSANRVPAKPSYKKGVFSEGVSQSLIPYKVYTSKVKSKKVVFIFGGKGTIGESCGKKSLYYEIKAKRILPEYHIVFVQKEKGSWKQYDQEAIASMIDEVKGDLKAKEVYFVGFSQGMYDSKYICTSKKGKWNGGLFIDGAGNMRWVKKSFNYSIIVAGYDEGSYDQGECFDEYYEPLSREYAVSDEDCHERMFDWAVLNDETFARYNEDGLFVTSPLSGIDKIVSH